MESSTEVTEESTAPPDTEIKGPPVDSDLAPPHLVDGDDDRHRLDSTEATKFVRKDPEYLTGDQVKLVKLLGTAFIQRKDVKAVQTKDGAWMPVRRDQRDNSSPFLPWTMLDFENHLDGQACYGHYLLDEDNNCKMFAFDLDIKKTGDDPGAEQLRKIWLDGDDGDPVKLELRFQLRLMAEGLCYAIEDMFGDDIQISVCESGSKGLHVYGLYGTMPASVARQAAHAVLESLTHFKSVRGDNFFVYDDSETNDLGKSILDMIEVEVFPKQDELQENGLGNLMALPCGRDRRTGRWRNFVRFDVPHADGWRPVDPITELETRRPWWGSCWTASSPETAATYAEPKGG